MNNYKLVQLATNGNFICTLYYHSVTMKEMLCGV